MLQERINTSKKPAEPVIECEPGVSTEFADVVGGNSLEAIAEAFSVNDGACTHDQRRERVVVQGPTDIVLSVATDGDCEVRRQSPPCGEGASDLSVREAEQLALRTVEANALALCVRTDFVQHAGDQLSQHQTSNAVKESSRKRDAAVRTICAGKHLRSESHGDGVPPELPRLGAIVRIESAHDAGCYDERPDLAEAQEHHGVPYRTDPAREGEIRRVRKAKDEARESWVRGDRQGQLMCREMGFLGNLQHLGGNGRQLPAFGDLLDQRIDRDGYLGRQDRRHRPAGCREQGRERPRGGPIPGSNSTQLRVEQCHLGYQGQATPADAVPDVTTKKAAVSAAAETELMSRRMLVLPLLAPRRDS